MISDIKVTYFLSYEFSMLGNRIIDTIGDTFNSYLFIKELKETTAKDLENLDGALGKNKKNKYTEALEDKDTERDEAMICFRDNVKSFVRSSKPEKKAAAELVVGFIKKHGWTLYDLGYVEQSAQMKLLIKDLETEESRAAVATLGAGELYDEMVETNTMFEDMYDKKVKEAAKNDYPSLKDAKTALSRHLLALVKNIDIISYDLHSEITAARDKAQEIDKIITEITARAQARKTRKENEGGDE